MKYHIIEHYRHGWYISPVEKINGEYYYLWKDLKFHQGSTGWNDNKHKTTGSASGYYPSREIAEAYLKAYLDKKEKHNMTFTIRQSICNPERGWYILVDTEEVRRPKLFVHKDLKLHGSTGWNFDCKNTGDASGYYKSEKIAAAYLMLFKKRGRSMTENIEITVKVNGVETPLHQISELTLSKIREASKPKEVPIFQVCNCGQYGDKRLIFKVPENIAELVGQYVALDSCG